MNNGRCGRFPRPQRRTYSGEGRGKNELRQHGNIRHHSSLLSGVRERAGPGMKIPGETATQSNIVKPVPLEATAERIASLRLPSGFKIEKLSRRVISRCRYPPSRTTLNGLN